MPPRSRTPSYDGVRTALDAQWDLLLAALPGLDPSADSRVAGWTVREVEAHLTMSTRSLVHLLVEDPHTPNPHTISTEPRTDRVRKGGGRAAAAAAAGAAAVGVEGWAAAVPGLAADLDRLTRETEPALAAAVVAARQALDAADPARTVRQLTGTHTLVDALRFRLVEGVVHGLDVGIDPDRRAAKLVVQALLQVLSERVPGHAVEVRVPPYGVVQCVEGPRHTRGTPGSTVEADPLAWLEVATGRAGWDEAVRTGRIRVRGERADLSPHLPLLT